MTSILKKIDTKSWVIIGLGGVAVVASYALFSQWKHASLGRQVRRSVVRFLKDNGSIVQHGLISGGVMDQPMKVDTAVNATVVQMLNSVADQIARHGGGIPQRPVDQDDGDSRFANPATAFDGYQTYASMPPPKVHNAQKGGAPTPNHRGPLKGAATKMSPRQQRKATSPRSTGGATPSSPLEVSKAFKDDGGYAAAARSAGGRRGAARGSRSDASFAYNPDDMVPKGKERPHRKSVFTDDENEDGEAVGPVEEDSDDDFQ
ncbi:MAG: hypothetical protein P4L69_15645 [Desulfosporosinus sp.]|nr:hypothetical protein [Desulfosporosinus sp.]